MVNMNTININSFGSHVYGAGAESNSTPNSKLNRALNIAQKTAWIALSILGVAAAIVTGSIIPFVISFAACVSISSIYGMNALYQYRNICQTSGIVCNPSSIKPFKLEGKLGSVSALPTEHSADTEAWREELIKSAEHNIVLSGNYCGGKSFKHFLELIDKRMEEKPALKVVILSSPKFLTKAIRAEIKALKLKYPGNFSLIESPDIWHISPGIKKATNHTKCMVIDYGKYFILGGSGIKDNFVETGLDNLSKEAFLRERAAERHATVSNPVDGGVVDPDDSSALDYFIPGNFRDMDFVFGSDKDSKKSCGSQVYRQMLLLSYRWEQYNQNLHGVKTAPLKTSDLGVYTGKAVPFAEDDSLTAQLLKTPVPRWRSITTRVPGFEASNKKVEQVAFKLFASGPEQTKSPFTAQLLKLIKVAKTEIVIDHMYFHPTPEVMTELIEAVKRGVRIKIITAGVYPNCPNSHYLFAPRNKYNYTFLVNSLPEELKGNVEVFEYTQHKKGLHKKVIVIDKRDVLAGSSNLGYKSLETTSDHELNFLAQSKAFAAQTLRVCQIDESFSRKVEAFAPLKMREILVAAFHRVLAPLVG